MSLQHAQRSLSTIFRYLQNALDRALANMSASEPQLVANLIIEITNTINTTIQPIFAKDNLHLSASGVFVHQRPLVKSNKFPKRKPAAVEIGDLLLIIKHQHSNGAISRNALLLQAKKGPLSSITKHQNQNYLYAFWPQFKYALATPSLELYIDAKQPPTVPEFWGEGNGADGGISTIEITIVDKDTIK